MSWMIACWYLNRSEVWLGDGGVVIAYVDIVPDYTSEFLFALILANICQKDRRTSIEIKSRSRGRWAGNRTHDFSSTSRAVATRP